ncbi:transcriptional regulator with XRE-family HTH domain [Kibdelosporangium banguiense]|uniref:Transcriptional regulator with XRE-family HTH domain n=1 Tax=Kibdelosporangium banguiense TaxID=1365924 RepID=A0ABS4TBT6_9PSEU|nr:helix-turn-helix transcriptional regulator [Kibdelosporangium banguiense]MBP2321444.1 transcriptional regulator with XRE-family HTH domain [Kibdelosporangium banguiense]
MFSVTLVILRNHCPYLHVRKALGDIVSGNRKPPQARDRALGAQLKTMRTRQTELSLEAAAEMLGWSAATMSRIENGKRHISAEDVASILAVYRIPVDQRDALVRRAKAIDEPGWWSRPLPGVPDELGALASYEADANALTDWSVNIIPGLLQTYEYAKAYMLDIGNPSEDIEMVWMARLRRQQILPKIEYTAFIGEAAIRTPFGGAEVLTAQLKHLVEVTKRGIGVRLVPQHLPRAGLYHSWLLLDFPGSPSIAHIELLRGGVFLHDPEVDGYVSQRAKLNKIALSTAESRDILRKLIEQREGKR